MSVGGNKFQERATDAFQFSHLTYHLAPVALYEYPLLVFVEGKVKAYIAVMLRQRVMNLLDQCF